MAKMSVDLKNALGVLEVLEKLGASSCSSWMASRGLARSGALQARARVESDLVVSLIL